jgi:hypothetical protein
MADTPQIDWQNDPDFHQLPLAEKHKVLLSADPDYKALPPQEQSKALNSIHYGAGGAGTGAEFTKNKLSNEQGGGITTKGAGTAAGNVLKQQAVSTFSPTNMAKSAGLMAIDPLNVHSLPGAYDEAKAGWQRGHGLLGKIGESVTSGLGSYVGMSGKSAAEHGERGEGGAILGEAAVPVAELAAGEAIGRGVPALRKVGGEHLYTPEGTLKPTVKTIGQVGGMVGGGAYGAAHGNPAAAVIGAGSGYRLGPSLIEKAFPYRPSPEFPGAPLPAASDFYAHEGAERNAIRTKNEALNRQQAREAARQEKLQPIPTDTPTPISPGAPLPSANDFYAKEGAERNAILARGEGEKPASPEFPGAHLPSMEDFYSKRGEELNAIRRRGINEPKPTAGEVGSAGTAPSPEVMHFPEPRALQPGDKPGSMYSIPRDELTGAAQRGAPGAGDVLRNINKPIIYTPREGVGYPGPRTEPPPTLPPTVTAAHQPEVAKLETPATEGPQPVGVRKVGTANDRPQVPYKGGINEKGVEASMRTISPEDMVTGLSTEVQRMTDTLRNSPGRPAAEKAQMQQQIDQYQQRLDELRKSAQTKGAAQRAERQRVATLRSGRVF